MIYIDVDAAVTVPVNTVPLIDDTDFKTVETGVAYNASGMDLVWNFVTPNGSVTQTAVVPTTGGDYDWTHLGDGMYAIEIPASGGASINNDTEGVGYFTGYATGVLRWRSPDIVFRAAGLNDALIENPYSTTRGLAGTALPNAAADAAGGLAISDAGGLDLDTLLGRLDAAVSSRMATFTLPTNFSDLSITATTGRVDLATIEGTDATDVIDAALTNYGAVVPADLPANFADLVISGAGVVAADAIAISSSGTAADNLELQFDGTGLTGDTFPATQAQLGNLASGSAGISTTATSFVKAGAEAETNTYTSTAALDGTYHIVAPDAGNTDIYYQFSVGPNGVPISVDWWGYVQSVGDTYQVYFYNWGNTSWDQVGQLSGANGTTRVTESFQASIAHVGTAANNGLVRFRFQSANGTNIATDRVLCNYSVISAGLGYDLARVWVDEDAGTSTGTNPGTDGLVTNRSIDFDNAVTIANALGYHDINVTNGNAIQLTAALNDFDVYGNQATIDLNGANVGGTEFFYFAEVIGTGTSSGEKIKFRECDMGTCTLHPFSAKGCGFEGTVTAGGTGDYVIKDGYSEVAGGGSPTFTFSGVGATVNLNVRNWSGGGTWNFDSDCTASIEVAKGGTHTITNAGGSVEFRGFCKALVINTSGAGTINIVAFSGPITINGTGGTVNIYGQHSGVTDNSSGTSVNQNTSVDGAAVGTNIAAILEDTGTTIPGILSSTGVKLADVAHGGSSASLTLAYASLSRSSSSPTLYVHNSGSGNAMEVYAQGGSADAINVYAGGVGSIAGVSGTALRIGSATGGQVEVQAPLIDLVDGGRLDTIFDATLADTNELQTDDVPGLIAALNDISAADVKTQADQALVDIHLDHLLAVDYDPASQPGTSTALLNELIESDAGVSRFTANALEQGPAGGGGGGDATAANQTTIISHLTDIKGVGWASTDSLVAITADTNELQSDDVPGLIAALNDISTADVKTQVDQALVDIHLDHLLAVDYDPATKPGTATALLNELIESDAGISRFTANALEQAPDSVDATAANQTTIITHLTDIKGASWVTADNLAEIAEDVTGLNGAAMRGTDSAFTGSEASIRAEIDANSVLLAAILLDTNELQTDDVPGLIAALNNVSTAQVKAQVDQALVDIHLDHLLAVDYDPAAKPGVGTALLNELIESDAGVSRFTVNALEQAPAGGGASDPLANNVPGAYAPGTAGYILGTNLDAKISSIASLSGAGSVEWVVTIKDSSNQPIGNCRAWVTTDLAGTNVVAGTLLTDDFGNVTFNLNVGTYYLWRDHSRYNFTNPKTMTVTA